jgi:hypothetical protein
MPSPQCVGPCGNEEQRHCEDQISHRSRRHILQSVDAALSPSSLSRYLISGRLDLNRIRAKHLKNEFRHGTRRHAAGAGRSELGTPIGAGDCAALALTLAVKSGSIPARAAKARPILTFSDVSDGIKIAQISLVSGRYAYSYGDRRNYTILGSPPIPWCVAEPHSLIVKEQGV